MGVRSGGRRYRVNGLAAGCPGHEDGQDRPLIEQPMLGRCGWGTGWPVRVSSMAARPASQELIQFARARIGYKAPEEIVVLDQMPLTATGKLDRTSLKRMAEANLARGANR
jgi:acyl-CoA synthetase (AMP-forming)/AMP-acid ligase II